MKFQKGFSLIEVLVAVAILSVLGVGVLASLTNASGFLIQSDSRETAKNLAEYEMEYAKGLQYVRFATSYPSAPIPAGSEGFNATIIVNQVDDRNPDIQKVTVTVSNSSVTYSLEEYKVNIANWGH
jgi:prepilin-type N-terminal cleavage/methylation domain-containing protein